MDKDMISEQSIKKEEVANLDDEESCIKHHANDGTIAMAREEDALVQLLTGGHVMMEATTSKAAYSQSKDPYAYIKFARNIEHQLGHDVFLSLLTKSWRKYSNDIVLLKEQLNVHERLCNQPKYELQFFNPFFQDQKERLNQSAEQRERCFEILEATRFAHEEIVGTIKVLRTQKSLLDQLIMSKNEECLRIEAAAKAALRGIEREMQDVKNECEKLRLQIDKQQLLNNQQSIETSRLLAEYENEVEIRRTEFEAEESLMMFRIQELTQEVSKLRHDKQEIYNNWLLTQERLIHMIKSHLLEIAELRSRITKLPSYQCKKLWNQVKKYREPIYFVFRCLAHILIPVVPQPKVMPSLRIGCLTF